MLKKTTNDSLKKKLMMTGCALTVMAPATVQPIHGFAEESSVTPETNNENLIEGEVSEETTSTSETVESVDESTPESSQDDSLNEPDVTADGNPEEKPPTEEAVNPEEEVDEPANSDETETSLEETDKNYKAFSQPVLPYVSDALKSVLNKDEIDKSDFTNANLALITDLAITGQNIESLEGFEKLTGLVNLDVSDNLIKDVTPLVGLQNLDTLNLSFNLIFDYSQVQADSLSATGNLHVMEHAYDTTPNIGINPEKTHFFKAGADTIEFNLSDLFVRDEGYLTQEEMDKTLEKLVFSLSLEDNASSYYDFTYDPSTKTGVIKDLGKQPGKDVALNITIDGKSYQLGKFAPKRLNNTELKDPLKNTWQNAYGMTVYETEANRIFYSADYISYNEDKGANSKMYELKEAKGGIREVEITEGGIFILDGEGTLFLIDDYTNSGEFSPGKDVYTVATNIRTFSVSGYGFDAHMILLKENGELVKKTYYSENHEVQDGILSAPEYKLSDTVFVDGIETKETFNRYSRSVMTLYGEDDFLYYVTPHREDDENFTTLKPEAIVKTPFKKEDIQGVYQMAGHDSFAVWTVISLKNGKTHLIHEKDGVKIEELAVANVVDAKNHSILTATGDVYFLSPDWDNTENNILTKTNMTNVKKIVGGYEIDYGSLFYLTNDGVAFYDYEGLDTSNPSSIRIDDEVEDIFYQSALSVLVKKKDGNFKTFQLDYFRDPANAIYQDYNLMYLGLPDDTTPVIPPTDPEPPVVTPPVEPEPPVVNPPTEPEPPIVTPPVEPEPPVVVPPIEPEPPVVTPPTESEPPVEPTVPEEEKPKPDEPTLPPVNPEPPVVTPVEAKPTDTTPPAKEEPVLPPVVEPEVEKPEGIKTPVENDKELPKETIETPTLTPEKTDKVETPVEKEKTPKEEIEKLPQTGDVVNQTAKQVGILSLLMGSLFFFLKRKKKNQI